MSIFKINKTKFEINDETIQILYRYDGNVYTHEIRIDQNSDIEEFLRKKDPKSINCKFKGFDIRECRWKINFNRIVIDNYR